MAGGKDQKDANQMIRQTQQSTNTKINAAQQRNEQDIAESKQRAGDLYSSLRGAYGNLAGTQQSGIPGTVSAAGGGGGGGAPAPTPAPGPADPSHGGRNALMDESLGGLRDFAKTGGWSDERIKSMQGNIDAFKDFGKTGGINDADAARMRGGGVYDEFAQTGGLSEADRANIRKRGTSVVPSMFGSLRNEANRAAAVQGGYGPGRSALASRLSRQQAGAAQDATLNAELGIAENVRQGRLAGAEGMASSEGALQSLRTGNQLAGLRGASDVESGLQNSINAGRQFGIGGIGSQGEADRAAAMGARETDLRERSLNMQGGAQAAAQANFDKQFAFQQQMAGLGGLASLYGGQGSGEYNFNKNFGMEGIGQEAGMGGDLATRLKSGNKSWADYVAPVAGAASGAINPLASLGGNKMPGAGWYGVGGY